MSEKDPDHYKRAAIELGHKEKSMDMTEHQIHGIRIDLNTLKERIEMLEHAVQELNRQKRLRVLYKSDELIEKLKKS